MKRQPKVETPEEKEARFKDRFHKLLDAANSRTASPKAIEAFRDTVADCRREGFEFWRETNVRSPLEAALWVVLEVDAQNILGGAIPVVWKEQAQDFLKESGHADASPIEKTLIEHAAVCWLRLSAMEIYHSVAMNANNTLTRAAFIDKRLTLTQRRYARAVETLSRFRMMAEATRLLEARADAAGASRRLNNMRTLKAATA